MQFSKIDRKIIQKKKRFLENEIHAYIYLYIHMFIFLGTYVSKECCKRSSAFQNYWHSRNKIFASSLIFLLASSNKFLSVNYAKQTCLKPTKKVTSSCALWSQLRNSESTERWNVSQRLGAPRRLGFPVARQSSPEAVYQG